MASRRVRTRLRTHEWFHLSLELAGDDVVQYNFADVTQRVILPSKAHENVSSNRPYNAACLRVDSEVAMSCFTDEFSDLFHDRAFQVIRLNIASSSSIFSSATASHEKTSELSQKSSSLAGF